MTSFPIHAHSEFSVKDGMGSVEDMAATVADYGQPAMALTDHGNVAGMLAMYRACKRHGLAPFPGTELYLVRSLDGDDRERRFHLGVLALDYEGVKALVTLSSLSHRADHFHRKPLVPFHELLEWGETAGPHVAITTGCYFGWVIQHHLEFGRDVERTAAMVKVLASVFPNTFVEVQNHNIDHGDGLIDADLVVDMLKVADLVGLPVVAGQDSHYCDAAEQPTHDMMKTIAYRGTGDNTFPGDGFHLCSEDHLRERHADHWHRVDEGFEHLLDLNMVTIPALDSYRFRVPRVIDGDEDAELRRLVDEALEGRGHDYEVRAHEELAVIRRKGMAGYFLLNHDYTSWCRRNGIFVNARGSANGSLVCYLLGITNVDSVKWGTDFDRFLSLDRAKPPDIDMDIESDRRDDVIDYIRSRFHSVTQIGTWGALGISDGDADKGSVFVQWHAAAKARGDDGDIPPEDLELLRQLDLTDVRQSYGAHAGGFVLPGADLPVEELLATMWIPSSKHHVTQAPMDDVEDAGYTKLDLLGLKSLSTLRRAMELIGKDPVVDGMEWIPDDDPEAAKIMRSGQAENGVFQFEGFSTAMGAKRLRPRTTADAIVGTALFRPALMNGGQTDRYLAARRSGRREHIHSTVDDLFAETYGVPIWQDDVLNLMRRVGLSEVDRNAILKAVKSSNDRVAAAERTFASVHPVFVRTAMANLEVSEEVAERMWAEVAEFQEYGFGKAHGTGYGLLAYRMAYLKAHHPTEFMCALLDTWTGKEKEPKYINEAHRMGMTIRRPHINESAAGWKVESEGVLRRGFRSIHGIGPHGAVDLEQKQPFESVEDLCQRADGRALPGTKKYIAKKTRGQWGGALLALREAGALKSLGYEQGML